MHIARLMSATASIARGREDRRGQLQIEDAGGLIIAVGKSYHSAARSARSLTLVTFLR
jgi:hypothetical protein